MCGKTNGARRSTAGQVWRRRRALVLAFSIGIAVPAYAQVLRVSVAPGGVQADKRSFSPKVSGDGRFVAFTSEATNLVANDTNAVTDVFVHDRLTGTNERISVGVGGQANGFSGSPSITPDGRFVAFTSAASNLVSGDTNGVVDVFVRDRQTATTARVHLSSTGVQANDSATSPQISANGRFVVFRSRATNLVANDTNGREDIFRRDREANVTVRVSVTAAGNQANNDSFDPAISADGRFIAFGSFAPLAGADTNNNTDVFLRDVTIATTTLVSVGANGQSPQGTSGSPTISADGRFIAYTSSATNIDAGGGKGIFLLDRQGNVTTGLGLVPSTTDLTFLPGSPSISGDGRVICYLVRSPTGVREAVLVDRQTLAKTPVSVAVTGAAPDDNTDSCVPSGDGTVAAFSAAATNLVAGDTNGAFDVFVKIPPPAVSIDKTALTFAAVTSAGAFITQTGAQLVRLTQDGTFPVPWTATPSQPWLRVSPASGAGPGTLSISVVPAAGLPPSGIVTATITFSLTNAANALPPIAVRLTLAPSDSSLNPFGNVDTPTDNRTGVTGALPFTGWALDDIEVTRVSICRDGFGAEVAPIDPNCGGAAEVFVGFAVFIDGARPDVAASFPLFPLATRAGWGFMVLTNMLPNQGNGTYRFTMRAQDREGHWIVLGVRTMTCANATATLPFGTLDTPEQGGIASGAAFPSFGWALTPLPKTIPTNGSTIRVFVDGVDVGPADYNHLRPDIEAAFPALNNSAGAVGFRILDTTAMTNGLHTISWTATDDAGAVEGIGSRFFTVSNSAGAVTAAAAARLDAPGLEALPLDTTTLVGRRGWDLDAGYESFGAGAHGTTVIRGEEVSRVELQLGEGNYDGYLRTPASLSPLPIGSRLDPATNTFTWAPGVGFVGRYDFVFVRSLNGRAVSRRDVRIVLHAKGRGSVGPQVVIDGPRVNAAVRGPFMLGGWAVDLDAAEGTGVSTLHAWAFPAGGGAPIFLGATAYGGQRPDVGAVHGDRFTDSGFGLVVQGVPAGDYDLALFAWSTETMGFVAPTMVRVRVIPE